ncbi:transmembrane protein, putative [Bodo saltans]|uniref:Transmembrane protein, putative n=1 Tax=Bodo saltans TaxID=75058 RepID=A0A0S4J494_BODSA|nr:transmembrane protein, putative [Bodo saltans]|eukprot:CUG86081.1 transmembrane protein, putative [Bodo saltans]
MPEKAQVGIYTSHKSAIAVLILSQNSEAGTTTIAVGQGVKGSNVRTVPSSAIRLLSSPISFDLASPLVTEHCESNITQFAGIGENICANPMPHLLPLTITTKSSASLLQSMVAAPFDSITEWSQPQMTIAFVLIAAMIFFLKNAAWLFPGFPFLLFQFVDDSAVLEPLLLVMAASLAVAASYQAMDEAYRSTAHPYPKATIAWRLGALIPLILVTTVGTIHQNWSAQDQATSLLGRIVRSAYPWLDVSVDEMCLYTIGVIAILRKLTGAVKRH